MHSFLFSWMQAVPAADATHKAASQMSLFDYIQAGGPVGYVIIILSIVALGLIIANFIWLQRSRLMPPSVASALRQMVLAGQLLSAKEFCNKPENSCMVTRTMAAALARCESSPLGLLEIRTAVLEAAEYESDNLYRGTDGIGLLAAIGPMLGLLGTVIGMIGAFGTIGQMEGAMRSQQLSDFMSIALVDTAMGLIVAIPCTAAYTLLRRRIERMVAEVSRELEAVVSHIERLSAGGKPARPQPVPQGSVHGASA